MNAMAPPRPTELHGCQVRLPAKPAAVGQARCHVQAAIGAWAVPVDEDVAVLLTSELVTNAITHQPGRTITVAITCSPGQLRVDVHDTSRALPVLASAPADAETGRGLMLVDTLSEEWGSYRTPAGKAVYFTLAPQPGLAWDAACGGLSVGTVSPIPPAAHSPRPTPWARGPSRPSRPSSRTGFVPGT